MKNIYDEKDVETLNFLSGTAIKMLGPLSFTELFKFISDQLYAVAGGALISFSEFDVRNHKIIVRELRSTDIEREKIVNMFGREPEGLEFDFPEEIRARMIPGGLDFLEGGFYDLVFGQLPQPLCKDFERELNIGNIYAMGCSVEEDILGTVAVMTHEHNTPGNKELIESIVNQAALVLKRLRSEEALRESEEKFSATFNSNPNALVLSYRKDGAIIDANDAFLALFERTREEVVGKTSISLNMFVNPEDRDKTLSLLHSEGRLYNHEIKIRRKSGEERIILLSAEFIHINHSNAILSTIQDITDRKRMEEALKQSEKRYRELVESANSLIVRWDVNGILTFVNEYTLQFLGYSREEVVGENVMMFVPNKEISGRDLSNLIIDITSDPQKYIQFENENIRKNGEHVWINWTNRAITDDKGNLVEILAIGNDNTERKKIEEELRINEAAMEAFFESSPGILVLLDDHFKFIKTDKLTPTYLGLDRQSIIGRSVSEFSPFFTENYMVPIMKRVKETGQPELNMLLEAPLPLQQDELGYFSASFFPVPLPGGKLGLGCMGVDVTENKHTEKVLTQERELFESIINNIPVMITIYDPELKNFKFNKEYKNILGWNEEDAANGNMMSKVYPDPDYCAKAIEYMKSLKPGWKEWRLTAKDGTIVDSSWANILLSSGIQIGIGIDIRQRKQDEKKLLENEQRLQIIFNNAPIGIVETDNEDRYIHVNDHLCRILGYTREELIGKTVYELTAQEDRARSEDLYTRLHKGEFNLFKYEKRYLKKDDIPLWVNVTVSALPDAQGHYLKLIGTIEDISERKKAEENLHKALAQAEEGKNILTALMEYIPIGITIADAPDVNIRMVSQYGQNLLERSSEEIAGIHAPEHPSIWGIYRADGITHASPEELPLSRATMYGEIVKNEEWIVTRKDGTLIPILCNAAPILDKEGKVVGGVIGWQDIAEQRRTLDALKESEEKFRSLFENITEGVALHEIIYENNNPVNYRVLDINPAFKEYTGITQKKTEVVLATELFDKTEFQNLNKYAEVANSRQPFKFETYYSGTDKYFVINVISPKQGQFATVLEDITEQKKIEHEMQLRNEELSRFIYTVSHDLKSPLVTIKMFTSYLRQDINKDDKEAQEKDLGFIENAADRMGRLLNELLELSRIGRKEEAKSEILLETLAQMTIDLVAGRIRDKKVKVLITAPPVLLCGYTQRLIQLYQNLLDNAVKFMGNQPEPTVEIGAFIDKKKELILYVRDNGIGIEARFQHKLFGLFEKLDPHSEGTGIGLALVKRIVEVHGGRIWFTSDGTGKGTTFYFTLEKAKLLNQ